MNEPIPLRIAEPTGRSVRSLRRYHSSYADAGPVEDCPAPGGFGYHDASITLGEVDEAEYRKVRADDWPHDDQRWPRLCACGYQFTDDDHWQRNDNPVYRFDDGTGFVFTRSLGQVAPAGTMVRAYWFDEHSSQPGESWLIALPDGSDWITTQPASDGGYWTVTGTAPNLTATPSVFSNPPKGWHGWIRDGYLVDA